MLKATSRIAFSIALTAGACGNPDPSADESGGENLCTPGETMACYTGPQGTENVGTCVGGVTTCGDDGDGWSLCSGEVRPILEVCENGLDDDCNGSVDDIDDIDGDGWTRCDGDCCETYEQCDEPTLVNPGAVEVPPEGDRTSADENCNGETDEALVTCDDAPVLDSPDAVKGAAAIDICRDASDGGWGIISAQYVRADGSTAPASLQTGLMTGFGPNVTPRLGSGLLVLSSGNARTPQDVDPCMSASCFGSGNGMPPSGFPQDVPNCSGSQRINDDIALELRLRAPVNANGFSFDFKFYSFEYPEWVCSSYNDQFVAFMDPPPVGAINGNIAFDSMTNPVSVNIAYFDVCEGCPGGTAELEGTGFDEWDDAGATSWLRTTAPIEGGQELTLRFMIWDTGDASLDSTVLIDNFQWSAESVPVSTDPIE